MQIGKHSYRETYNNDIIALIGRYKKEQKNHDLVVIFLFKVLAVTSIFLKFYFKKTLFNLISICFVDYKNGLNVCSNIFVILKFCRYVVKGIYKGVAKFPYCILCKKNVILI